MTPRADLVFVYGTLRRGQTLHEDLEKAGAEYVDAGKIRGRLYDLGEYPGAVPSKLESEQVLGELYRLDRPDEQLPLLDALEECDREKPGQGLFLRQRTEVWITGGKRARAWVYFLPSEPMGSRRIPGGDYTQRRGSGAG